EMMPGQEIGIRIAQTLTQDATGTMVWLEFESMRIPHVRTELSVSYVDHNMLQNDFRNADDHRYLQSITSKDGAFFSRPGRGICHQVHTERFGVPGKTLLGSDSHTPNAGGLGMVAIGAGGMDVAVAMGGGPFYLVMPKVVGIELTGQLPDWVTAKDVILAILRRLSVKGGLGKVMEYYGSGVATLTVDQRTTICNMGAELGATTSLFPSDDQTRSYLAAQGRAEAWTSLEADPDATYDESISLDLSTLEPLIAQPSNPDRVVAVREIAGTPVAQVCIGSCVNSSFEDLTKAATILKGKSVHANVSLTVTPGSKQVYTMIAQTGALADMIDAGARILEAGCGPCVGMGQAPPTNAVSVRSSNRNFRGRSGTIDDQVFLASPETCAATALKGVITDPRDLGAPIFVSQPTQYLTNDNMILAPSETPDEVEIIRGPNIKPIPDFEPLPDILRGHVLIKVEDNITTDHIMPAGAHVLPLRSNIPAISDYVFWRLDPDFVQRAKKHTGGFIVGGSNYGQGSSREHAALSPRYLGIRAVLAKSFSRIHHANLINMGILPLTFTDDADSENIAQGDQWEIRDVRAALQAQRNLTVLNPSQDRPFEVSYELTERHIRILLAGGLLNTVTTD
ncbi:MAG: aconitate hydratase, partial [Anaerolineae bacterium]|nr:aconitate hydratase [Anaerolineae bacterium]